MPTHHQSRRQFLVEATLTGLTALISSGCGRDAAAATPVSAKAPPAPTAPAIRYTLSTAEQKLLAAHISNLRLAAQHDKQKALLLSAYTDPQVLDFLKNLAQGTGPHPTLFKYQFKAHPDREFGRKVFAVIQDSLNQGLPAIGAVIVKLQQKANDDFQRLPEKLKSAQIQLALVTTQLENEAMSTNSSNLKLFNERRDLESQIRSISYAKKIAPRSALVQFKVETVTPVTVDGDYGKRSENVMSTFSTRQCLLDPSFPHVKLDRKTDTGIGARTLNALAYYDPKLALFLRCDEPTLVACMQHQPAVMTRASR